MYCIDFNKYIYIYLLILGKNVFNLWLKLRKYIHFNIKTVNLLGSRQLHFMISIYSQDCSYMEKVERLGFENPIQIKLQLYKVKKLFKK
jgi:hypothetical protein